MVVVFCWAPGPGSVLDPNCDAGTRRQRRCRGCAHPVASEAGLKLLIGAQRDFANIGGDQARVGREAAEDGIDPGNRWRMSRNRALPATRPLS